MRKWLVIALVVVLSAVGWLWYDEASGARAARLARSDDPEVRLEAVGELRGRETDVATKALARLTGDDDPRVASAAIRALGGTAVESSLLLAIMTDGSSGRIRGEAAAALADGGAEHRDAIIRVLREDPDDEARAGAARGLGRLRDRAALPALVDALDDRDGDVRVRAAAAIAKTTIARFPYDARAPRSQRLKQAESIRRQLAAAGMLGGAKTRTTAKGP